MISCGWETLTSEPVREFGQDSNGQAYEIHAIKVDRTPVGRVMTVRSCASPAGGGVGEGASGGLEHSANALGSVGAVFTAVVGGSVEEVCEVVGSVRRVDAVVLQVCPYRDSEQCEQQQRADHFSLEKGRDWW